MRVPGDLGGRVEWRSGNPVLVGSRCPACATTTFPRQQGCPSCAGEAMDDVDLPPSGTLWTLTVQRFCPKEPFLAPEPPAEFEPFAIGYVDLGGVVRVEARLVGRDVGAWAIGDPVTLRVEPLPGRDPADERSWTHCFGPAGKGR